MLARMFGPKKSAPTLYQAKFMPTIGIASVTIPGALECMAKIYEYSQTLFPANHHPHMVFYQPNFEEFLSAQTEGRWDDVVNLMLFAIENLKKAGASFIIIPSNTPHRVIDAIQERSPLMIINMLDVVAAECARQHVKRVAVLGTRSTMASHLYKLPLEKVHIEEIIPKPQDQDIVNDAIFNELVPTGTVTETTMRKLLEVIQSLKTTDCDAIAMACTELPLVLNDNNCHIKTINTTAILAQAAVNKAFQLWKHHQLMNTAPKL